jgi:hypothetical protein
LYCGPFTDGGDVETKAEKTESGALRGRLPHGAAAVVTVFAAGVLLLFDFPAWASGALAFFGVLAFVGFVIATRNDMDGVPDDVQPEDRIW